MKTLVTGGAGFIGSNIVENLLKDPSVSLVRVMDNLATGHYSNIETFETNPRFEFIKGDIKNPEDCQRAVEGMDVVCHQAALGSVPRSIKEPVESFRVNAGGFVNMLDAAREAGIKRFVYASSSAVYGDLVTSPKQEDSTGNPLSPYASSKKTNELYAEAYYKSYDMEIFGFRYFNVFGPKQDPNGPYAAVIPIFMKCALENKAPTINGDGSISRDFTFVRNVVSANILALKKELDDPCHEVINIACGGSTDLNELWTIIKEKANASVDAFHGPERKGDIQHSLANISKAQRVLSYEAAIGLDEGLAKTYEWYLQQVKQETTGS